MGNSYVINVPDKLSMISVDEIYRAVRNIQVNCSLVFDFSQVTFVTPQSLILLVTASRHFRDQLGQAVEWKGIKTDVLGYMDRMNINSLDFISIERPSIFLRRNYHQSNALVELTTIQNPKQIGNAILQTKEVLNRWFPDSGTRRRQHLLTLIKETVENSIEHSSTVPSNGFCYYVLQKYGFQDGSSEVQIAVGDTGIGMLASQRRVHPTTKDDAEAMIAALMDGRSGRESGGGGMGYVNIREALGPLQGKIYIRSGRAHVEHIAGASHAKIYRHVYTCPGTQIIFSCRA